ncbi:MAG: nodulation protein nolNO [Methylococcaceae bacterium]|nr:nodulation protein nolNO [Methylococcaceae bacterium]
MKTYYVGLNASYHDPALAIVGPRGEVRYAEATERLLQNKRALNCEADNLAALPDLLERHCPDASRLVIALDWNRNRPWYERLVNTLGVLQPAGLHRTGIRRLRTPLSNLRIHHMMACNRHSIKRAGLNLAALTAEIIPDCQIEFLSFPHHLAHAALACRGSGFSEAACAVVDSYGENGSAAFYHYRNGRLGLLHEARGLGSLGLLYMKLTELCGFDWMQGEEWKVMGLAAYGNIDQDILNVLRRILRTDGLSLIHPRNSAMTALARLEKLRRPPHRPPESASDLACTGQYFFGEIMAALLGELRNRCKSDTLCLAGGCALNSSFNGQIKQQTEFSRFYIPPAPADDGSALGAAWLAYADDQDELPAGPEQLSAYLGSSVDPDGIRRLEQHGTGLIIRHPDQGLFDETAKLLAEGKLVAWIQGQAEFGPRALGNRSILADPRDPAMTDRINARVKLRERFRPFAPAILHEFGGDFFENYRDTPYMECALRFRSEMARRVPAVVHRDGTGRLQSVTAGRNPRFHALLRAFHTLTGVPILLNTSCNVMGKPMVHSAEDAVGLFMTSGLDALALGDTLFIKPSTR